MANFSKASLKPEPDSRIGEIKCMFNPTTLEVSKANTWKTADEWKNSAPNLIFDRGQSGKLNVDLTLDTTDSGEAVTDYTNKILQLMEVESLPSIEDPKSKVDRPPWVQFCWGRSYSFKSVVTSATVTFTYFSSAGKPLRATAKLALEQYEPETQSRDKSEWPLQNPTSYTPEVHRLHTVKAGETLDRIAFEHYGDSALWKAIARSNRILDPLDLTVGTHLQIPEREAVENAR